MEFSNMIGSGPSLLSKIQNRFTQPPGGGFPAQAQPHMGGGQPPMPPPRPMMDGQQQAPQGSGGLFGGAGGGAEDLLSKLLAGDSDKSGLLSKIALMFAGGG